MRVYKGLMSRIGVASALAGAALLVPGSAGAKGPNFANVCGTSGCATVRGEFAVYRFMSWWNTPFSQRGAPAPAPFYKIKIRDPSGIRWSLLYAPSRRAMRIWQNKVPPYNQSIGPYWRSVPRAAVADMAALIRKVKPYAAQRRWPG
jgi:hypothetical protein